MLKNISFFLKLTAFFLLVFIWVYTIISFEKLPETIPVHFGIDGKADGFGSKNTNWLLVGISTLIFIFCIYISRNPQSQFLNIPQNLKDKPEIAGIIVDVLNVFTMLIFAVITFESIKVSLNEMTGLSSIISYILGLIFLFIIVMMIYSWRLTKKSKNLSDN